jgi:hypothetical protein
MNNIKQPSSVRGNKIHCINYQQCPLCYGCRAYDSRDPECYECKLEDDNRGKNYNICNKELHEGWKINKIITKNKIILDNLMEDI